MDRRGGCPHPPVMHSPGDRRSSIARNSSLTLSFRGAQRRGNLMHRLPRPYGARNDNGFISLPLRKKLFCLVYPVKIVDFFRFYAKISLDMKMQCGNEKWIPVEKREGEGVSPLCSVISATSKQPGRTGTGAPVTEHLRCP